VRQDIPNHRVDSVALMMFRKIRGEKVAGYREPTVWNRVARTFPQPGKELKNKCW
jgi:hypothetical protein